MSDSIQLSGQKSSPDKNADSQSTLLPAVRAAIENALIKALEEDRADTLVDPLGNYPPPIELGATAYRDCAIWGADWRKRLPPDHAARPSDETKFSEIGKDEDYNKVLALMLRLDIPSAQSGVQRP
jgi:hypothetical protein